MKIGQFFKKAVGGSMILAALACPVFTSCYDDSALNDRIDKVEGDIADLDQRLKDLETRLNSELQALQTLLEGKIAALQGQVDGLVTVKSCTAKTDGTYEITLSDGSKFTVYPEYEQDLTGVVTTTTIDGVLYWAIYEDGKPVVVTDAEGNPVPVVGVTPQVDVDPATGNVYVTFDGEEWINIGNTKPCVFSEAEVVYTDNYTDEEEATGWYEETPMYVTITLPDGNTITVTIDGAAAFIFGGHMGGYANPVQYMAAGSTKDIAFMTTNIQDWIKEVPNGWTVKEVGVENAEFGGASFQVTAPTAEAIKAGADAEGHIKVIAVAEGGSTVTASIKVTTKPYEEFGAGKGAVTVKMNNGLYAYLIGISKMDEYQPEAILSELKPVVEAREESPWGSYPLWDEYSTADNATTYDDNCFMSSIEEYPFADLRSIPELELGEKYVVWSVAVEYWEDANYNWGYLVGDIKSVVFSNTLVSLETTVCSFNDIQISAEFTGIESYYGAFAMQYSDELNKEGIIAEFNSSLTSSWESPQQFFVNDESVPGWANGVYTGNPNDLVQGWQTIQPGEKYYLYIIPVEEGKTYYSMSDVYFYEWATDDLIAGSSIAVTAGEPELDFKKVSVPLTAEDAVYIYYYFVDPEMVPTIADKQAYLLENGYMSEGTTITANKTGLNPGQTTTLLAMAVDQYGAYGEVFQQDFAAKEMTYAAATVTAELQGTPSQTGLVKISCDAEVDTYYYWYKAAEHFTWGDNYYGTTVETASAYIALTPDSYYMNKVTAAELPADGIEMTGLTVGSPCYFVVSAKLTDGTYTKATFLSFTPEMNFGNFIYATDDNGNENAAWVAAKPVVTTNVQAVGDFTTVSWSVEVPEGYSAITACFHQDYLTDYPSAKSKVQFILTSEYIGSAEVVAGETYTNYYASPGYNVYTVVWDAEGNYYETFVTELNITGGFGV